MSFRPQDTTLQVFQLPVESVAHHDHNCGLRFLPSSRVVMIIMAGWEHDTTHDWKNKNKDHQHGSVAARATEKTWKSAWTTSNVEMHWKILAHLYLPSIRCGVDCLFSPLQSSQFYYCNEQSLIWASWKGFTSWDVIQQFWWFWRSCVLCILLHLQSGHMLVNQ